MTRQDMQRILDFTLLQTAAEGLAEQLGLTTEQRQELSRLNAKRCHVSTSGSCVVLV